MKREIFDMYVDAICEIYNISKEDLFSKNKMSLLSTARYMLYYMCTQRNMKPSEIKIYLMAHKYEVDHAAIIRGSRVAQVMVSEDMDYKYFVEKIKEKVDSQLV